MAGEAARIAHRRTGSKRCIDAGAKTPSVSEKRTTTCGRHVAGRSCSSDPQAVSFGTKLQGKKKPIAPSANGIN